jgi:hypothetical protein
MTDVRYNKSHHSGGTPEARVANRLKNSGAGAKPDHIATHGEGPTRTHTNIHDHGQGAGAGRGPRVGDKQ